MHHNKKILIFYLYNCCMAVNLESTALLQGIKT